MLIKKVPSAYLFYFSGLNFFREIYVKAIMYDEWPKMKKDAWQKKSSPSLSPSLCRASLFIFGCSSYATVLVEFLVIVTIHLHIYLIMFFEQKILLWYIVMQCVWANACACVLLADAIKKFLLNKYYQKSFQQLSQKCQMLFMCC